MAAVGDSAHVRLEAYVSEAVREAKAAIDAERNRRAAAYRAQQRRQWRCFWTRPIGHRYVNRESENASRSLWADCVGCGKSKWAGPDY